jgi:Sigma-70 region 2
MLPIARAARVVIGSRPRAGDTSAEPVTIGGSCSCKRYMDSVAHDDRELLLAARRGDAESFAAFFREHHSVVLAFLARRVEEPEAAADLLAETFASLLTVVRDRRRELPKSPLGWLLLTARNLLIDRHRHEDWPNRSLASTSPSG